LTKTDITPVAAARQGVADVYLNRAQKYVLELLGEFGALKKSQLEVMTRYKIYAYLANLNGYLRQMYQEREIDLMLHGTNDAVIFLPGTEPDYDLIAAFDLIAALRERAENYHKARGMPQIAFDYETEKNRWHQAFAVVVHPGGEQQAAEYADRYLSGDFQTVFFLCDRKTQMKKFTDKCTRLFAVKAKEGLLFFKNP
jgi:hypothetical protein